MNLSAHLHLEIEEMPSPPVTFDEKLNSTIAKIFVDSRESPWNDSIRASMLHVLSEIVLLGISKRHTADRIASYAERFPRIWIDAVLYHGLIPILELMTASFYVHAEWGLHDEMTDEEFEVHLSQKPCEEDY